MIYSVWSYERGEFDYYNAPGVPPATGSFQAPRGSKNVPECLAEALPPGATRANPPSGDQAKGTVATTTAGPVLGFVLDDVQGWMKYVAIAAAGAWAGRKWWKR